MNHACMTVKEAGKTTVLAFFCELDAASALHIQNTLKALLRENTRFFIVDLRAVSFLDSHGVGLFALLLRHTHERNGFLAFCGAEGQPKSVLKMVGFDGLVKYYDTVEDAINATQADLA